MMTSWWRHSTLLSTVNSIHTSVNSIHKGPLTQSFGNFFVINSLWPSDAIWWERSGSTLAPVMACCLTAPSHYLNQCWLIISKVLWCSCEDNFTRDTYSLRSIFSQLSIMQYGGCVFSAYPFPLCWLREYIYFVLLSSSNRKYELLPIV